MAVQSLYVIEQEAKPQNIDITRGFVGQAAPNFDIGDLDLFVRGPDDGDPTADTPSPHLSPAGLAVPIYVVDRTDVVRNFVGIH